jgi:hypothetical protein
LCNPKKTQGDKMRLSQLASQEFKSALSKLMSAQLPIKTTFRLKKLVQNLEGELKLFEETRHSIVQEYGEKDEAGNLKQNEQGLVNLDVSKSEEWQVKLSELMMIESTLELPKLTLSDFGDKVELSANDLFALGSLISEE